MIEKLEKGTMFKSGLWRNDKNKIKAVFRLQFHVTELSDFGGDELIICLVPADIGKPTVRLDKATVRDGSCYWEKPVYETVKFLQEPQTKKIHKKFYHFVLSTGSSKTGVIGEVSIDLANYAQATKISSLCLPLINAKSKAILHVSIQRVVESVVERVSEESEIAALNSLDHSLRACLSSGDMSEILKSNCTEEENFNKINYPVAESNGNHRKSSGSDITLSGSDSSSGLGAPQELGTKNITDQVPTGLLSCWNHASVADTSTADALTANHVEKQKLQWNWMGASAHEVNGDNSSCRQEEAFSTARSEDATDIVIQNLRTELAVLARQAELSGLELQTLRKQIVKESRRGQDLSKELVSMKEQRDALKEECKKLKAFHTQVNGSKMENKLQLEGADPWALLDELRQELNYEKEINANLSLQFQKTQESNSELILAVHDLEEMLDKKNREIFDISKKLLEVEGVCELCELNTKFETDDDEEQKALEELVKEHSDAQVAYRLEQKIMDLHSEIEIYRREKDEVEMQMEQLALDYEILKQENHDSLYKLEQSQLQEQLKMQYECSSSTVATNELEKQIEFLDNELRKQSKDFSDSLVTINELEIHIKCLDEELEKQALGFLADLEALTQAKVEQEQRAIQAEEALRKLRWKNAGTAERLQEEFRRLSMQMASTFCANEKLAAKALTEANELCLEKFYLQEKFQKADEEQQSIKDHYEQKLHELLKQMSAQANQIEAMQSEITDKSSHVEYHKMHQEETEKILSQEILKLKAEVQRLMEENKFLFEQTEQRNFLQTEVENMKISIKENETIIERGNTEKSELENMITLMKMEFEKSLNQIEIMRCLLDQKESIVENLQAEKKTITARYDDLKVTVYANELENDKLRKQVLKLESDIRNEGEFFSTVTKLKDNSNQELISEGAKEDSQNNKSACLLCGSDGLPNRKEINKLLESRMKEMETALETSANAFLQKEKDLQTNIEESQRKLEELHQNSSSYSYYEIQTAAKVMDNLIFDGKITEVAGNAAKHSTTGCMLSKNGHSPIPIKSDDSSGSEIKSNTGGQRDIDELLNELAILKEGNRSMQGELKDMQERYSQISLEFAEVEGERQKLVMMLRNLKNTKKI